MSKRVVPVINILFFSYNCIIIYTDIYKLTARCFLQFFNNKATTYKTKKGFKIMR